MGFVVDGGVRGATKEHESRTSKILSHFRLCQRAIAFIVTACLYIVHLVFLNHLGGLPKRWLEIITSPQQYLRLL